MWQGTCSPIAPHLVIKFHVQFTNRSAKAYLKLEITQSTVLIQTYKRASRLSARYVTCVPRVRPVFAPGCIAKPNKLSAVNLEQVPASN